MKRVILALLLVAAYPASAATTGQTTIVAPSTSSASSITLDLADDGTNESTSLSEIATTGDANSAFTHPSAGKLLIDLSQPWPMRLGDLVGVSESGAGVGSALVSTAGPNWAPVDIITEAELDTEAELEAQLVDVTNILTDSETAASALIANALAANGSNCPPGQYPLGVDAAGAVEDCTVDSGGSLTRVLTVDAGGLGDYTTVKAAVDFAASQTPTQTTPWVVRVTPGWYLEDPFTVPAHVHVQGVMTRGPSDTHVVGETFIYTDDATGDFITLAAGSMSYVSIASITDATGTLTVVASTQNGSYLHAVSVYTLSSSAAAPVRLLESRNGTLLADTVVLQTMDAASSQTDFIRITGGAHVSVRSSWLMCNGLSPRAAVYHESTGHAVFYDVRIGTFTGSTFTTDFANINGGTLAVSHDTGYKTATGTVPFDPWGKWFPTERGEREAPTATSTPLTIKGATSQTADLTRFLNSSDTEIASVDAAGTWTGGLAADSVGLAELAACAGPDEIVEYGASGVPTCIATPSGGGGGSFTDLTSGTNTTAAMVAGSGSSLKIAGTGTIDASGIDADGDGTRELTCTPGSTTCTINPAENSIAIRFENFGGGAPWLRLDDGSNTVGFRLYSGLSRATYGASEVWGWGSGAIVSLASGSGFRLDLGAPSATAPVFIPNQADPDTGACWGGENDYRVCAGGSSGLGVTTTAVTNFREILRLTPQVNAPATCGIGDFYVDTSGAYCACSVINTWENMTATGSCT